MMRQTNFHSGHIAALAALALSAVLHLALLSGIVPDWPPHTPQARSSSPIDISLKQIVMEHQPSAPELSPEPPPPATTPPPQEALTRQTTPVTGPHAATPVIVPDNTEPVESPSTDATVLRNQLLASIRQPAAQQDHSPAAELPANWTQDALPQTALPETPLLEPLTYTGPVTTERWKSADGTPQTRTVLADGTVVCGRGHTFLPNSNFEANVMLMRLCGKETGGRENQNRLARYHPANSRQTPQAETQNR